MTEQQTVKQALQMERLQAALDTVHHLVPALEEVIAGGDEARQRAIKMIADGALSLRTSKLNEDEIEAFIKHPYVLRKVQGKIDTYDLIIPKMVDVQMGWLESTNEAYNIFRVNRYVDWLGDLPEKIKQELDWKDGPDLQIEGDFLKGSEKDQAAAWIKYRPHLLHQDKTKGIQINPKRIFLLLAEMIKDGILPFTPKPVDPADIIQDPIVRITLRDYQQEAWSQFLTYSMMGIFMPPSVGKTYLALWGMTHLKGPHLVSVPSKILREQWTDRIEYLTDLKKDDFFVMTYQKAIKVGKSIKDLGLHVIDEVHHLPANQFAALSQITSKWRMGLTASPFREDGRDNFIYALTGYPWGLGWDKFKKLGLIKSPTCEVYILKNIQAKLSKLGSLLEVPMKTIIFADGIALGASIAAKHKIPHIHGATKGGRVSQIQEALVSVVSRVGDEGLSIPELRRVIEIDFLAGSRRQELQRFGRLLHGEEEGEYYILMTVEEYASHKKRLFSIMDKGFNVKINREGVSDKSLQQAGETRHRPKIRPVETTTVDQSISKLQSYVVQTPETIAGILAMPGIQNIKKRMTKAQIKFWDLLLKTDGTWYKRSRLPMIIGYGSVDSMRKALDFTYLINQGWIEVGKIDKETAYRTNMSTRMQ